MSKIPLMIVSDNVNSPTGLGRISREISIRIHENLADAFRLGTLGYGGSMSRRFRWTQYQIPRLDNWSIPDLPKIWNDFSGGEKGVLLAIWNPSSMTWLADPTKLPAGTLKEFLMSDPFARWLYAPVDAEGPNGKLPVDVSEVMVGFDRTLCYTSWAADLLKKTSGLVAPHLPHGTDTHIFYPRDRKEMRKTFIETVTGKEAPGPQAVHESIFLVGCVGTNSFRKNWEGTFKICQELRTRGANLVLWAHTDQLRKNFNLPALAEAYGMKDRVVFTNTDLTDEQMAEAYCACNVTIMPSLGEGFGMPIFESLACGVPCIHIDYAGAAEFLLEEYKVKPTGFFGEGFYGHQRPISNPSDWADKIQAVAGKEAHLPSELAWDNLWPRWEKWLVEGVNGESSPTVDAQ